MQNENETIRVIDDSTIDSLVETINSLRGERPFDKQEEILVAMDKMATMLQSAFNPDISDIELYCGQPFKRNDDDPDVNMTNLADSVKNVLEAMIQQFRYWQDNYC